MEPVPYHCLRRDDLTLVFGLEWFPLLGDHIRVQAKSIAARRRGRYCVITAGAAASVGVLSARLPHATKQRHCSAAAAFATLHPTGTVATVLSFSSERHWLVAVHEGSVMTRTDQIFHSLEQLHETLRALRDAHPSIRVHDEGQDSSAFVELLFGAAQEHAFLSAIPPFRRSTVVFSVALMALIGGSLLIFSPMLWRESGGSSAAHVVDAEAAWKEVVAQAARRHGVHGVAGLQAVLDALHAQPAFVAGWRLKQVDCRPSLSQWQCRSEYGRSEVADNMSFLAAARPDWKVSFDPMDGADVHWSIPMIMVPLNTAGLRRPHQNEAWLVSALQAMLPAFTELRLESPQSLSLRPPLDAQERPIARPPGIASYRRRAVRVQAPLRSLSLLLPETAHIAWERLVLMIAPIDQPTVSHSGVRVTLSGVLYEIDDPLVADSVAAPSRAGRS